MVPTPTSLSSSKDPPCISTSDFPCDTEATRTLREKINGQPVRCEERDRDRYGRIVAVCYFGCLDLNAWMVAHSWAVAYRRYLMDYTWQRGERVQSLH